MVPHYYLLRWGTWMGRDLAVVEMIAGGRLTRNLDIRSTPIAKKKDE